MDVQHTQYGTLQWLKAGETLLIERDEDSSPTTMFMRASNEHGAIDIQGTGKIIIIIKSNIHNNNVNHNNKNNKKGKTVY